MHPGRRTDQAQPQPRSADAAGLQLRRPGQGRLQGTGKRLAALALAFCAALIVAAPAGATDKPTNLPARTWVVVDADDGTVLAAHHANEESAIASTTKLMTAFVARKDLRLGQTVTAADYQPGPAESLLGLEAGERIKVRDLLYGLLMVSGNDAAETLAEAAAGSRDAFVKQMNAAARRLNLKHTSYANPIGLDEAGNYSSAADLTTLAIKLRQDKLFRKIFDTASTTIESGARPRSLTNRNVLVQTVPFVNGVKTGYTLDAGNVLVGSGEQKGVELVSAVIGAPSESDRDAATMALLDYGFSLYHQRKPVKKGERLASLAIQDREVRVPLAASKSVQLTVRKGQDVETKVAAAPVAKGPVSAGERFGTVTLTVDGKPEAKVPLVATQSAAAASLTERFDADVPGPRIVAWGVAAGAVVLAIGGSFVLRRRWR
jgi:D-alanyl-D-alanine carboxypeptidase (penicillin-binding protein 5/6)